MAGKRVRCPSCNEVLEAPADSTVPPPVPPPAFTPASQEEQHGYPPRQEEAPPPRSRPRDQYADEPRGRSDDDHDRPRRRRDDEYDDFPSRRRFGGKPHRGSTVLTLGILSLVCCGLIGLILGISALNMANNDLREMDKGIMDESGRGQTNAGRTCAIIGIILSVVGIIFNVMLIAGRGIK
jgi:hypothetical protein